MQRRRSRGRKAPYSRDGTRSRASALGRGGGRRSAGARARRGGGAVPRSRRSGPGKTGRGERPTRDAVARPRDARRTARRRRTASAGTRRCVRGRDGGAYHCSSSPRRSETSFGTRRHSSQWSHCTHASEHSGWSSATSARLGPSSSSPMATRPEKESVSSPALFPRSRSHARRRGRTPEVNAIRARSLASTRECGARGFSRGSRSTDDAASKVHRRVRRRRSCSSTTLFGSLLRKRFESLAKPGNQPCQLLQTKFWELSRRAKATTLVFRRYESTSRRAGRASRVRMDRG